MNRQLELLLQIQDLKSQKRTFTETEAGRDVEEQEFNIDIASAMEDLNRTIEAIEGQLDPTVEERYRLIASERGRAIVPVINGTCYGCFVSIPTALASDSGADDYLRHCDNCGRFFYVVS